MTALLLFVGALVLISLVVRGAFGFYQDFFTTKKRGKRS